MSPAANYSAPAARKKGGDGAATQPAPGGPGPAGLPLQSDSPPVHTDGPEAGGWPGDVCGMQPFFGDRRGIGPALLRAPMPHCLPFFSGVRQRSEGEVERHF